jgi:hypothetical protein
MKIQQKQQQKNNHSQHKLQLTENNLFSKSAQLTEGELLHQPLKTHKNPDLTLSCNFGSFFVVPAKSPYK